jgi:hypothetical protein
MRQAAQANGESGTDHVVWIASGRRSKTSSPTGVRVRCRSRHPDGGSGLRLSLQQEAASARVYVTFPARLARPPPIGPAAKDRVRGWFVLDGVNVDARAGVPWKPCRPANSLDEAARAAAGRVRRASIGSSPSHAAVK